MESGIMAAGKMVRSPRPARGREDQVSDDEVEEAIALFGGDPREAVRALVGALHHLVSKGYARGRVRVIHAPRDARERAAAGVH
jgi:hypothetical protein